MISLQMSPQNPAPQNTVLPFNLAGPSRVPNTSLNLDEKKAEKKVAEEKKKKQRYGSILLGISVIALLFYSIYFFYPNLKAYLNAPAELARMENEIEEKNTVITTLQQEKGLHKAAYTEENQRETAILEAVFPTYDKLKLVRDIENASNTLKSLGTFEMNAITVDPPVQESSGMVSLVSGNFRASERAFDAFINEYVGNSGNLENPNSTITKAIRQISIKPTEIKLVGTGNQPVTEKGYSVSFKLAFYTRAEDKDKK